MKFTAPIPFKEALDAAEARSLLPTTGKTRDLQQLDGAIKRRALFSATVESVSHLQKIDDVANGVLSGKLDLASSRLAIKNFLADVGYAPDPEKAGGLQDLSSTSRINLQVETYVDTANGYGWDMQGQQADVLDEFPAQELIRDFATTHERGSSNRPGDLSWPARWQKAGGEMFGGRMIGLKNSSEWLRLGDPDLFPDGLGNPYPPFAFNSGMGVRDIGRDEAEQLGVIEPNQQVFPRDLGLNDDLKASPEVRSDRLRSMLEDTGLGEFDDAGVFHFKEEEAA